jgi:hypothetical protein
MTAAVYEQRLEALLLELAQVNRALRQKRR